ncbi:hypothetical protein FPZ43_04525 [Mucilaginibacter pallidiroseus]|uniref:Uncharacterized protein n=1 Tax=Mucilaginibacter pallidiroseus TaxID=2599295 RepID=A0A563UFS7_9SPHI|nr:hypothetical protein [Mucilaginibacter pallidiroseus]TWR30214.1 hypothetical protein FPZ43_04525 [Mucilaginibacter pallidiroseus]
MSKISYIKSTIMTFEEFFAKKKIDLAALQVGQPGLFWEFKSHFEQMGEKSFDHTKKYWFNKLRLQYHLASEVKTDKVHIENQIAEQTIAESLGETVAAPSVGFKPRFKAAITNSKPEVESSEAKVESQETGSPQLEVGSETPAPKPAGFKPRFNKAMTAPKPEVENPQTEVESAKSENSATETPTSKPAGFKPRFNIKTAAPKTEVESADSEGENSKPEVKSVDAEKTDEPTSETTAPKPAGFKPRFNMKMASPKSDVEGEKPEVNSAAAEDKSPKTDEPEVGEQVSKPAGFKPRFNMKMAPKPSGIENAEELGAKAAEPANNPDEIANEVKPDVQQAPEEGKPADAPITKPAGFKPRFKPKPPQE